MVFEPFIWETRNLFEHAGLLKEVSCTRYDLDSTVRSTRNVVY